nr:serine hydrolase domain-containing protein [Massilia polaris]
MKTAICLLACVLSGCSALRPAPEAIPDAEVHALMRRNSVEGLALAVIERGKVVKVSAYGRRNVANALPLAPDTIMYGASLTKTAFAYMLLQLADEGKLDLDAPLSALLPQALPSYDAHPYDFTDLANDQRWRRLTPRILLTHASGFANFRWLEPDKKLRSISIRAADMPTPARASICSSWSSRKDWASTQGRKCSGVFSTALECAIRA